MHYWFTAISDIDKHCDHLPYMLSLMNKKHDKT